MFLSRWIGRSRIVAVAPDQAVVALDDFIAFRVTGRVHGYLYCAGQRRWAWGRFVEVFQIPAMRCTVSIRVVGLGGVAETSVSFHPRWHMRSEALAQPLVSRVAATVRPCMPGTRSVLTRLPAPNTFPTLALIPRLRWASLQPGDTETTAG